LEPLLGERSLSMAEHPHRPAPYRKSIATILHSAAIPYGVTLTVWASGAALVHFQGNPRIYDIFLFVFGGMGAYSVLAIASAPVLRHGAGGSPGPQMALTGILHLLSIGAAVGAVSLVAEIDSWIAWPLGGFAGIGLYLGLAGVEFALAPLVPLAREAPRDEGRRDDD
jgi:hypothetical protein